MVLVTVQKIKDFLIERLQKDNSGLEFEPIRLDQGCTISFTWEIYVQENDLLDMNDITFHIPEIFRNRE